MGNEVGKPKELAEQISFIVKQEIKAVEDTQNIMKIEQGQIKEKQELLQGQFNVFQKEATISYEQAHELSVLGRKKVVAILEYGSKAYKLLSRKLFSSLWHDYQDEFNVNTFKNTNPMDFARGRNFVIEWQPNTDMNLMILGAKSLEHEKDLKEIV